MPTGHDLAMGLRAAYWSMHRQTNACLAQHGATAEQFVILALLAEEDGITQKELCSRASSDPNTIRPILMRLEQRGLVRRDQHPTDGRARHVILTRKGRQVHRKLARTLKALEDQLSGPFQTQEREALVSSLGRISQAMTQQDDTRIEQPTSE